MSKLRVNLTFRDTYDHQDINQKLSKMLEKAL